MSLSSLRRFLVAASEISALVAASLATVTWSTAPAHASVIHPVVVSTIDVPSDIQLTGPWISSNAGTEWTFGTTSSGVGTLVSRNRVSGVVGTQSSGADEAGALAAAHSPLTDVGVFSVRRPGNGNRIIAVNLSTGVRLSSRNLAVDENVVRAIAFNAAANSYLVGTNLNPAKVMKFDVATGNLQNSVTLGSGLKEITAFVNNGTELLAVLNTTPVKMIPVARTTLTLGSVASLPAATPTLLDPVVIGGTAYLGTDARPGIITAIDLATRTVIGTAILADDETGARHLVASEDGTTLYATTQTPTGPRVVSLDRGALTIRGRSDLGSGEAVTSMLRDGHRLVIGLDGTEGIRLVSIAPEPDSPRDLVVTESDGALAVSWTPGASVEPVDQYAVTATSGDDNGACLSAETTCTITGLRNGTRYTVSVIARSIAGESAPLMGTGSPRTVPDAPVVASVVRGNSSIVVTWIPGNDGGRPITEFVATAMPTGATCVTSDTACVISGLPNGTPHTVTVVARSSVGSSVTSTESDSVTPATVPGLVVIESVSSGNGSANLSWTDADDDGGDAVTEFVVRLWSADALVSIERVTEPAIELTNLENGRVFLVTVAAVNGVGEGEPSMPVRFEPVAPPEPPVPPTPEPPVVEPPVVDPPPVGVVPMSPTALTVLRRNHSRVTVGWVLVDPGTSPVTDYRVETSRYRTRGFRTVTDPTSVTPWIDVRRPRSGSLFVRVIAVNSVGESRPSTAKRVSRRQ